MKILLKKKKNDQFQFVDLKQNTVPYIAVMRFGAWLLIFLRKEQYRMKLVLAEKPSVAMSLSKVIGADQRGDGSATWTVHYEVSKTSTSTHSGQEGPFASQAEADAAAEAAKNAAIGQLQNEAQGMVDATIAAARAQLANITFSYDEVTIPHGFDATPGALGSHQTITVPANSSNDYKMQNDEWSVKVSIDKIDSETKQRIKDDAEFEIFEWDTVRQCYIPFGGYNRYKVERQSNGTYKVINHSNYANGSGNIYYTQRNEGKFVIVESRAPSGDRKSTRLNSSH